MAVWLEMTLPSQDVAFPTKEGMDTDLSSEKAVSWKRMNASTWALFLSFACRVTLFRNFSRRTLLASMKSSSNRSREFLGAISHMSSYQGSSMTYVVGGWSPRGRTPPVAPPARGSPSTSARPAGRSSCLAPSRRRGAWSRYGGRPLFVDHSRWSPRRPRRSLRAGRTSLDRAIPSRGSSSGSLPERCRGARGKRGKPSRGSRLGRTLPG